MAWPRWSAMQSLTHCNDVTEESMARGARLPLWVLNRPRCTARCENTTSRKTVSTAKSKPADSPTIFGRLNCIWSFPKLSAAHQAGKRSPHIVSLSNDLRQFSQHIGRRHAHSECKKQIRSMPETEESNNGARRLRTVS